MRREVGGKGRNGEKREDKRAKEVEEREKGTARKKRKQENNFLCFILAP